MRKNERRVAVIAGTPVDTQMGVEFINKKVSEEIKEAAASADRTDSSEEAAYEVLQPVYCPVSENCDAQVRFQYSDEAGKRARIDEIFDPEIAKGTKDFFIYCNSLSGAFDFDSYAEEKCVNIYTPLQIYRKLGGQFGRVGVIAANNISAHGIEKALLSANDDIYVIGSGNMSIVRAIERAHAPAEIIKECGLEYMVRYMETCGAEAMILGCTHFPYIKGEFEKICSIPVIDPADMMYAALVSPC
ncbi:MAG: aspartate/glutamate racemase family protein [Mogibacterium sp.]|nr:aspartate/glutamate racemase family protein [Mogibacterium sp.]